MTPRKRHFTKIAVVRANALGDFIFSLPAFNALKTTYPQAELVLLGKKWHSTFLRHRPSPIDRVIIIPPTKGVGLVSGESENASEQEAFFLKMKAESFSVAIQLHGGGKYSNPFTAQLGADVTVGLQDKDAISLDYSVPYIYYQNEVLRLLETVKLIGATTDSIEPQLTVIDRDLKAAEPFVHPNQPFVILHPGASDIRRRWSEVKFAQTGDFLIRLGYQVVLTGTESEKDLVDTVISHMKERNVIHTAGKLSLNGLAGLLSKASLVISNDTGPFHLARAIKTPAIGIYWCGNLVNAGPIEHARVRTVVSWQTHCPACGLDIATPGYPFQLKISHCSHLASFVDSVKVSDVLEKAIQLLTEYSQNFNQKKSIFNYHTNLLSLT